MNNDDKIQLEVIRLAATQAIQEHDLRDVEVVPMVERYMHGVLVGFEAMIAATPDREIYDLKLVPASAWDHVKVEMLVHRWRAVRWLAKRLARPEMTVLRFEVRARLAFPDFRLPSDARFRSVVMVESTRFSGPT